MQPDHMLSADSQDLPAASTIAQAPLEIVAAPFTPFHPDEALNLEAIPAYVDLLLAQGVRGVFVCGTTGEGVSLTSKERMQVAEAWKTSARSRLKVIVHVGHNSLAEAACLASHAAEINADAIAAMPPSFFRPEGTASILACCERLAAAAPAVPFYYYHIPGMTHVAHKVSRWIGQAAARIPNFAGVKFTFEDMADFQMCREIVEPGLVCYFGRDELFLNAARDGTRSFVGSTYNYAAQLYHEIDRRLECGDVAGAKDLQGVACGFIERFIDRGFFDASKLLMGLLGVDMGPPRLPLLRSPGLTSSEVRNIVEETGLSPYLPSIRGSSGPMFGAPQVRARSVL
jgi:N-acetylneuraminate lyase